MPLFYVSREKIPNERVIDLFALFLCCSLRLRVLTLLLDYLLIPNSIISGLPDAASIEAVSWVEPDNDRTVLIDASTAFRVDEEWTYGFPGKLLP